MLISTNFLRNSLKNYQKNKKLREGYTPLEAMNAGVASSFDAFILAVAVLFFILEFFLLYYAISMALRCTKSSPERITHLVLATIFTLPYALIAVFFGKCQQGVLGEGNVFLTNRESLGKYNDTSFYT